MLQLQTTERRDSVGNTIRQELTRCLAGCMAMNMDTLLDRLGCGERALARELDGLVAGGEVEVLVPEGPHPGRRGRTRMRRLRYYRLRRESDNDHLWQQTLAVAAPGRILDADEYEARRPSAAAGACLARRVPAWRLALGVPC